MIDEVTITNLSTNVEYIFDKDNSEFLLDDNGIIIEELKSNYNTYTVYGRVGRLMDKPQLSSGIKITVTGWVIHTMMTTLDDKKQQLVHFFNPLQELKLRFKDREIQGYPQTSPKFGASRKENNDAFCKFQVIVFCPNPSFKTQSRTGYGIQGAAPSPYTPPEGHTPTRLDNNDVLIIDYKGTIPTAMSIVFNINPFQTGGTWTEHGARIQRLAVNPVTGDYDLSQVLEEFATRDMNMSTKRLYLSENPNPGWYSYSGDSLVSKFTEIDVNKPEFIYLDPGLNAIRLTTATGASLGCYDILLDFQEVYTYPREEW